MNENTKEENKNPVVAAQMPLLEGSNMPKTVGIIFSEVKRKYFPTRQQYITEKDAKKNAREVAEYIEKLGIKTTLYPGNATLINRLKKDQPELVFNLVDSVKGNESLASTVPGMLEMFGIPYTGVGIVGCALCYNKFLVMKLLEQLGIKTPRCELVSNTDEEIDTEMKFPLIAKLNEVHGGLEINYECVSDDMEHLKKRIAYLIEKYDQPVLVQEFIEGRELSAFVIEGLGQEVFLMETVFTKPESKHQIINFDTQWVNDDKSYYFAKFENENLRKTCRMAFDAVKMSGYGKFDIRVKDNEYYFIDSNPNNAFGPKESNFPISIIMEDFYNITFAEIVKHLIEYTFNKKKNSYV